MTSDAYYRQICFGFCILCTKFEGKIKENNSAKYIFNVSRANCSHLLSFSHTSEKPRNMRKYKVHPFITCNIAISATLHYVQHCIMSNIALCATMHFVQQCIMYNNALCGTMHYVQHYITCNIALRATLHYVQHCIKCKIALRTTLHYVQHCITCKIALVELSSKLWISLF